MIADFHKLGPYFRNGKLFLPEYTVNALIGAGLDESTAKKVLHGLSLDDYQSLQQLSQAIGNLVLRIGREHPLAGVLSSEDSYFALHGMSPKT